MKKLIAAVLVAGVVMATGTILTLAANQELFVCPGDNDACVRNGACLQGECPYYADSSFTCPGGNNACVQNGACLQGECPYYADGSFTCPGGNDACVQNGACLQGECAYYTGGTGGGSSTRSSGTGHHRERGHGTGCHNR